MKKYITFICAALYCHTTLGQNRLTQDQPNHISNLSADIGWTYFYIVGNTNDNWFETQAIGPSTTLRLNYRNFDLRLMCSPLLPYSFAMKGVSESDFTHGIVWTSSLSVGYQLYSSHTLSFIPHVGVMNQSGRFSYTKASVSNPRNETIDLNNTQLFDLGLTVGFHPVRNVGLNLDLAYSGANDYSSLYFQFGVRIGQLSN